MTVDRRRSRTLARWTTFGEFRAAFRNWPSLLWAGRVRHRLPPRVVLRGGGTLGPPGRFEQLFGLAHARRRGWTARPDPDGVALSVPHWGVELACRWDRGFDLENAIEVFEDRVYGSTFPGFTIVDLGAGTADASLAFVAGGARRVLAFEPHPESFRIAQRNVAASRLGDRIELRAEAVGAASGTAELRFPSGVPSAASLVPAEDARRRWSFDGVVRVPVRTLASVLASRGLDRVDLLKIDAQGAEYGILGSASDDDLARIDRIIVEYTAGPERLVERLRPAGFRVETGRTPRGYLRASRTER